MGYDNTGNYTRAQNFSADASAGIKILAARVDSEFDDVASAMTLPLLRDGRNAATGNIPMGGYRLTNVGAPTSATNYIRAKDFIENVPIYMIDAEASADRISVSASFFTTASAATAPRDGSHVLIKAGSDKSSAVAIRLNTGDGSPHSAGVILANGSAIYSGAIRSGGIYEFIWSSSDTAWQIANPQVDYANETYPGVILVATTAEAIAGTNATKAITPATLLARVSASAATTASAGQIEIATTAEVGSGTDATRAIVPSALRPYTPFVAILAVTSTNTWSFLSQSPKTSAWAATAPTGPAVVHLIHNLSAASTYQYAFHLTPQIEDGGSRVYFPVMYSVSANGFSFSVLDASGNSPASVNVHILGHQMGIF